MRSKSSPGEKIPTSGNRDKYLEVANALGDRLCRDVLWSEECCNWRGDFLELTGSEWKVVQRFCRPELYSGTAGIALFLAHLFSCTQREEFKKTARGALNLTLLQLADLDLTAEFGFYNGLTGIAYVLTEVGTILGEEEFVDSGLELLDEICAAAPAPGQSWDILSGSAGVIPVLLKLHGRYGKPCLLEAALRHGHQILQAAIHSNEGCSWKTPDSPGSKNLTGFSHGAAGIAWALIELFHKSGERRFLTAAQEALRYERTWFDPQQENWPDFRCTTKSGAPVYSTTWCHGAPGIGLARLRCHQLLQDQECLAEAQAAVRTTAKALTAATLSDQGNFSLCHGKFGNADLLIAAADMLGDNDSLQTVIQTADTALAKYHLDRNPWPCGVLNGGETPNLMLGLAGIGYFYLRLYDRTKTPSVLLVGPE